jgi:hypothetical protein
MKPLRLLFVALILSATQTTDAQVVSVFLSEGSVAINEDASIAGPTSLLLYPEDAFQFSKDALGFLQEDDGQIQWVELSNLNTFEALLRAGEEEGFFSQIMHLIFTEGVILDEDEVEMAGAVRGFGMGGGGVAMRFLQRWNGFRIASDTLVIKAAAYGDLVENCSVSRSSRDAPSSVMAQPVGWTIAMVQPGHYALKIEGDFGRVESELERVDAEQEEILKGELRQLLSSLPPGAFAFREAALKAHCFHQKVYLSESDLKGLLAH